MRVPKRKHPKPDRKGKKYLGCYVEAPIKDGLQYLAVHAPGGKRSLNYMMETMLKRGVLDLKRELKLCESQIINGDGTVFGGKSSNSPTRTTAPEPSPDVASSGTNRAGSSALPLAGAPSKKN